MERAEFGNLKGYNVIDIYGVKMVTLYALISLLI